MADGRDVMRAQLRHLIDVSDRQRNVTLQVPAKGRSNRFAATDEAAPRSP